MKSRSWLLLGSPFNVYSMLLGLLFISLSLPAFADSVAWDKEAEYWQKQESDHFVVSYLSQHQAYAERVLVIAETVRDQLFTFYQTTPAAKTQIIVFDNTDVQATFVETLEYGEIRLMMTPPTDVTDIESEDDWIHLYLSNEYSQILHFELASGSLRDLLLAAEFTPSMLIDGVAVYLQNNNELKSNLLNASSTEMKMRMEVKGKRLRPLNQVVIKTKEWPFDAIYFYGAYFIDYLANTYGEEKVLAFLSDYSQSLISYVFLNNQTKYVFGKDFYTLWAEFQQHLEQQFTPQIEALEKQQVHGKLIAEFPFLLITEAGKNGLLMGLMNGEDRHVIEQYQDQQWKVITPVNQVRAFSNHEQQGLLVTRTIRYADNNIFNDIFIFNEDKWRRITERKRFKYVHWMKDGQHFIASRIVEGISELWLFNLQQPQTPQLLWRGKEREIIGNFDISPKGDYLIASLKQPLNSWKLARFNIETKEWQKITNHHGAESSPTFTPDGQVLYSANYNDVYNIYRLNEKTQTIEQLTHVVGGAFRPLWQTGLGLVFQTYESQGYSLRHIEKPQVIKQLKSIGLSKYDRNRVQYNTDIAISKPQPYSTWATLKSHSLYPVFYTNEVRSLVGINTYGSDALARHNYDLYALWDTKNKQASYAFQYRYDNRWIFAYTQDYNFNNLTPQESTANYQISKSQVFVLQRDNILNMWEDKLSFHAGFTYSIDKLNKTPENVAALTTTTEKQGKDEELTLGLAFTYDNREYYLNVPGTGWGHYFDLTFEENVFETDFSGQKYQTQWHFTFDLPRRFTLLTRLGAGYSTDQAKPFSVGGNNLSEEMRLFDRSQQSIRGYDDLAQRGHIYATQRIELNTSLGHNDRNFGLFPLGLGAITGKVYVDSGSAWDKGESPEMLIGAGAQIEVEFKLGYNYTLPISLGYAHGFDDIKGKNYFYMNFGSSY